MARGEAVPTSKTSELYVALYAVFVNAELTTLYRPPVASASSSPPAHTMATAHQV